MRIDSPPPSKSDWFDTWVEQLVTQLNAELTYDEGFVVRPKFTWKDADEIYISAGVYQLYGKGRVRWSSQLTFKFGSAGSNASSTNLGNNQFHYVYLDYSAIESGADLTAASFVNSTTAPTWSETYHGWYNGSDRCIFGIRTGGSANVLEFFHSGGFVAYADKIADLTLTNINTTWTDVTLTIPGFATSAQVVFSMVYDTAGTTGYWRTNGQSGTTGHNYGYAGDGVTLLRNTATVVTSTAQIIEIKHADSNATQSQIDTDGWFFPIGM